MRMEKDASAKHGWKVMQQCFLCKAEFQFGPHIYKGRHIPEWEVMLCECCISSSLHGISPINNPHLLEYLKSRKLPAFLNKRGWIDLPRGSTPSTFDLLISPHRRTTQTSRKFAR